MFRRLIYLTVAMALTGVAHAQLPTPGEADMYCSGVVTTQAPPAEPYIVSGVESSIRPTFTQGNLVFINEGANKGVKVGDQFLVSRPVDEQLKYPWFKWQETLLRAMGQTYEDLGRLRVVSVQPNTATAEITKSCSYMQRGDIVEPFVERPAPPFKGDKSLDLFAPRSGKAQAMIVTTKGFGEMAATGRTVYVNLGSAQGVKVGDYFRIFRFQGATQESVYNVSKTEDQMFGFGGTPVPYAWSDLPRDILGEGLVLRVTPNAATVLITNGHVQMFPGDYVELE